MCLLVNMQYSPLTRSVGVAAENSRTTSGSFLLPLQLLLRLFYVLSILSILYLIPTQAVTQSD